MKIYLGLIVAILIGVSASAPAEAATCDATKSKFLWRRCMSKEIDGLVEAFGQKAFDICSTKTGAATGPAAVDDRLTCRLEKLTETLQGMK